MEVNKRHGVPRATLCSKADVLTVEIMPRVNFAACLALSSPHLTELLCQKHISYRINIHPLRSETITSVDLTRQRRPKSESGRVFFGWYYLMKDLCYDDDDLTMTSNAFTRFYKISV